MSKPTAKISRNLPDFPFTLTPAPATPSRFSALLSGSHFVTTVVSPASASASASNPASPVHLSSDPEDLTPEPADFFSARASPVPSSPFQTFPPSPAPAELLSARIKSSLLQTSRQTSRQPSHSQSVKLPPPRAVETSSRGGTRRLRSSKPSSSPPPLLKESSGPAVVESRDRGSLTTHHRRCRSSWRRLKKMGNRIATPFRSMGVCIRGGRAFCGDLSAGVSSTGSSWYSSGEYSPEFIRSVLENNVLLEYLTMD